SGEEGSKKDGGLSTISFNARDRDSYGAGYSGWISWTQGELFLQKNRGQSLEVVISVQSAVRLALSWQSLLHYG
ncbi:unnamed protein product, partial [Discosporangium mesarthrocarpum]